MSTAPSRTVVTRTTVGDLRRRLFWALLAAVGVAYELRALKDEAPGDTLSETTRLLFRTDTTVGKVVFFVCWGTLTAWFASHIARSTKPTASN